MQVVATNSRTGTGGKRYRVPLPVCVGLPMCKSVVVQAHANTNIQRLLIHPSTMTRSTSTLLSPVIASNAPRRHPPRAATIETLQARLDVSMRKTEAVRARCISVLIKHHSSTTNWRAPASHPPSWDPPPSSSAPARAPKAPFPDKPQRLVRSASAPAIASGAHSTRSFATACAPNSPLSWSASATRPSEPAWDRASTDPHTIATGQAS